MSIVDAGIVGGVDSLGVLLDDVGIRFDGAD